MSDIVPRRPGQSMLLDIAAFEHAQRVGRMMANSGLFPEHLRMGSPEQNMANAVMVLDFADAMGERPLTVAQNIYFVRGKAGWSATYLIARANKSGTFEGPIRWKTKRVGDKPIVHNKHELDNIEVTAYARVKGQKEDVEATVSMKTAALEGWANRGKDGGPSKYETMGATMLQYRSATQLIRLYAPEVMLGLSAREEIEGQIASGVIDITPTAHDDADETSTAQAGTGADAKPETSRRQSSTRNTSKPATAKKEPEPEPPAEDEVEDAEVVEDESQDDEAEADDGPFDPDMLPKEIRGVFDQIMRDMSELASVKAIDGMVDLFREQIDYFSERYPDAHAVIEDAISEAHERVSKDGAS